MPRSQIPSIMCRRYGGRRPDGERQPRGAAWLLARPGVLSLRGLESDLISELIAEPRSETHIAGRTSAQPTEGIRRIVRILRAPTHLADELFLLRLDASRLNFCESKPARLVDRCEGEREWKHRGRRRFARWMTRRCRTGDSGVGVAGGGPC